MIIRLLKGGMKYTRNLKIELVVAIIKNNMEEKDWDELFLEFENNKQCAERIIVFKNFLKKTYHPPVKMVESDESPYCPICTGCGEEGCCSPLNCNQDPNGYYCQTYLRDLKFGYSMHKEISNLIGDDPKYKDDINLIFDKIYDETYRN